MSNPQTQQRQAVIDQAVAFLDATDTATLTGILTAVGAREELRQDPARLRDLLAAATPSAPGRFLGAYHGAVQLLAAAGKPTT
jgi:hypothetical protein